MSHQGQPKQTPRDVRDQDNDVAMSQSSWTSSEDTSAEDSCTDEEHDQELFLEAYTSFTTKSEDAGSMQSLRRWFSSVERLPDSWPLARLSITLDGLTSQLSKIDLFEKDSFLFVKRVLPFAFASCVRDFKKQFGFWQNNLPIYEQTPKPKLGLLFVNLSVSFVCMCNETQLSVVSLGAC